MREGYDLVIGSRYRDGAKSDDDDWLTALGNWMFTRIVNVLFGTRYTDVLVGFRAYRRSAAAAQLRRARLELAVPEAPRAFARAGLRVTEIRPTSPHASAAPQDDAVLTGLQISRLIRDFFTFRPDKTEAMSQARQQPL